MVFKRNERNEKIGINWVEFLAFIVSMYLIISKLAGISIAIGMYLGMRGGK